MPLPIRLRAWNLLFPGSKAARSWTIHAATRELAVNQILIGGYYPADFARVGDPVPGHEIVDVLVDGRQAGGVSGGDSVLTIPRPAGLHTVTLRSFLDR